MTLLELDIIRRMSILMAENSSYSNLHINGPTMYSYTTKEILNAEITRILEEN